MNDLSLVKLKNIALIQFSIILLSVTGVLAKKASVIRLFSGEFLFYYALMILFMLLYAVLWQQIIKKVEISVAYANKGTLLLWTMLWAVLFFNESISINNIIGAIIVIVGITVVFRDV